MTTANTYRPDIRRRAARLLADELGPYSPGSRSADSVARLAAWLGVARDTLCRVWMDDRRMATSRPAGIVLTKFHGRRPS